MSSSTKRFRTALWTLVCTSSLFILGCKGATAPPSDVDLARQLLNVTLQAWKAGATVDAQRELSPPVYVADDLWQHGSQLSDYRLESDGQLIGTNVRFQVMLTCVNAQGKSQQRRVRYLVTTAPAMTIAREDS